jgi:hypothetical protein
MASAFQRMSEASFSSTARSPGKAGLVLHRDGVDVRRGQLGLPADALLARQPGQLDQHLPRALRALRLRQRQEGVAPFGGLRGVGVVRQRSGRRVQQQGAHVVGRDRGVHTGTLGRTRRISYRRSQIHAEVAA